MDRKAFLDSLNFLLPVDPSSWPRTSDTTPTRTNFAASIEPVCFSSTGSHHHNESLGPVLTALPAATDSLNDPTLVSVDVSLVPASAIRNVGSKKTSVPSPSTSSASTSLSVSQPSPKIGITQMDGVPSTKLKSKTANGSDNDSPHASKPTSRATNEMSVAFRMDQRHVYRVDLKRLQRVELKLRDKNTNHGNGSEQPAPTKHLPPSLDLTFEHCLLRLFCWNHPQNHPNTASSQEKLAALSKDLHKVLDEQQDQRIVDEAVDCTASVQKQQQQQLTGDCQDRLEERQTALKGTGENLQKLANLLAMPASVLPSTGHAEDVVGRLLSLTARTMASSYCQDAEVARALADYDQDIAAQQVQLDQVLAMAFPPPRKKQRRTADNESPPKASMEMKGGDEAVLERVHCMMEKQRHATTQKYRLALLPRRG